MRKKAITLLTAFVTAISCTTAIISEVTGAAAAVSASDTKFDEEKFFVVVGTYGDGITQLRYLYPGSGGEYTADKVVWEDAPSDLSYGDIFISEDEVSMTKVQPALNDPANAFVNYYTFDDGAKLEKVGNCEDLMEKKDLTVTSRTYDGSSHWSIRYKDSDDKNYYYGVSVFASTLTVDPLDCKVGDVFTYALYNGHIVVPLAKKDDDAAAATQEYSFDDILNMSAGELESLFLEKGLVLDNGISSWTTVYTKEQTEYYLKNGSLSVLIDPVKYMKIIREDNENKTEVKSADDIFMLIEDGSVEWDLDKIYSSLGLSPELFEIKAQTSTTELTKNEEGETVFSRYCQCFISPFTDNNDEYITLFTAILNYVQLNPDYVNIHFEGLGGDSTLPSGDIKGDVNKDGAFNIADVVVFQKWILAAPDTEIANWKAADFYVDNKLDVFDLCLMKKALVEQIASEAQTLLECEGYHFDYSSTQGWINTDYSTKITDKQLESYGYILECVERVREKADQLKSAKLQDWGFGIDDYGEDNLYLPFIDEDGNADRILLCKLGSECASIDDNDVWLLINRLNGIDLFGSPMFFLTP